MSHPLNTTENIGLIREQASYINWPVVALVLLIMYLLDVNYYYRVISGLIKAKLSPTHELLDEAVLYSRVLPFDGDMLPTHMNNARVIREFDFGRWDLWARTGIMKYFVLESASWYPPQFAVAHGIRYRRPLHMFAKYKVTTRIVYWEGKTVYHEHKIITLKDNVICAISYTKIAFPFKLDEFAGKYHPNIVKPEMPNDLEMWIKFNEAHSLSLKSRINGDDKTSLKTD